MYLNKNIKRERGATWICSTTAKAKDSGQKTEMMWLQFSIAEYLHRTKSGEPTAQSSPQRISENDTCTSQETWRLKPKKARTCLSFMEAKV